MTKPVDVSQFRRQALLWIFLLLILPLFECGQARQQTIVCIGDSLTACGGDSGKYTDWLQQWLPMHNVINKGIGGDTLAGGRSRFERDVLSLKPDVVVIELGANDFWRMERPIDQLRQDLEDMILRARQAGIQIVVASCFGGRDYVRDEKIEFPPERYSFADQIAKMEQQLCLQYLCFYVPNMQIDIKPNGRPPYWDDTNHPNKQGNRFVAKRILSELKKALDPAKSKIHAR